MLNVSIDVRQIRNNISNKPLHINQFIIKNKIKNQGEELGQSTYIRLAFKKKGISLIRIINQTDSNTIFVLFLHDFLIQKCEFIILIA